MSLRPFTYFYSFFYINRKVLESNRTLNSCCSEIGAVDELVDKNGLGVLSARDEWGYTPAHWAALDGNIEVSFRSSLSSDKE